MLGGAAAAVVATTLLLLFAPKPVEVDAGAIKVGPISETIADQGVARVREAYVVSSPVSGRLERVDLHVGDPILANRTIVARIWPSSADLLDPRSRAQAEATAQAAASLVGAAQAQLDRSRAAAREAESDLGRAKALASRGYASRQALQAAEADAESARAATRAAAADLAARRSELAAARSALMSPEVRGEGPVAVKAPVSGYVTRVLQESEQTLARGVPLVEIADRNGLEAAIEFLSEDAVRIREGMVAEVFDWGGPGNLPAVVRRVEPQGFTKVSALGVEEQRALVLLQFTGPAESWSRLGPGYRVWGRVVLRREGAALKAPIGALVRSGARWAVFRIVDGRARLTPVTVGALTDSEAEIRSGLRRGDQVVVFPSDKVADGVWLKIRDEGASG
jgi:HlyD family secretion protein